ncbi:YitT family protein [Deinococcus sp. QL22]|uniref:YczE/YyaS/YitT family protein n=1 Tax=Deinococcus sp. QL22 TaxID=2939437 RepID=UPI0020173B4A|nr:membrane protein [Deinococcus sp. QL22]UQN06625.1 membrane protein [Deinococcus sp. QL22]
MTRPAPLVALTRLPALGRYALLLFGLFLYGLSLRLMLDARVGVAPWEVLHVGITRHLPLSVGVVSILTGLVIVAFTALKLREPIGPGTVLNVIFIGVFLDVLGPLVPDPQGLGLRWVQFALGVALLGLATGTYVAAGLGAGPRDGLTLGLRRVYGWPVARTRTGVEVVVLATGLLLGGPVGWGTLVFALTVGPAMSAGMGLFGIAQRREPPAGTPLAAN